jgi:hypothetical protein
LGPPSADAGGHVPSSNLTVSIHGEALPRIGKLTTQDLKEQNEELSCVAVED